jgi:hypothetical protein
MLSTSVLVIIEARACWSCVAAIIAAAGAATSLSGELSNERQRNLCALAAGPNVDLWHEVDVQRMTGLGTLTGALPKFGAECRFTVAFQTLRWHAPKVGS